MASEPIHVDLSDLQPGAHAKVTPADGITLRAQKAIVRAVNAVEGDASRADAFLLARVQHLVPAWSVKDADGKPLPPPSRATLDHVEGLPALVIARILRAVDREWSRLTVDEDPNAAPSSAKSSPA